MFADISIGFFSAGLVTLPGSAFPSICPDMTRLGTRLGMSWGISSIASLIGTPIAGAILGVGGKDNNYLGIQLWSGVCLLLGATWLTLLWWNAKKRLNRGWRI